MNDERAHKPDSPSSMENTTSNLNLSNPPSEANMPTLSSMDPAMVSEILANHHECWLPTNG